MTAFIIYYVSYKSDSLILCVFIKSVELELEFH